MSYQKLTDIKNHLLDNEFTKEQLKSMSRDEILIAYNKVVELNSNRYDYILMNINEAEELGTHKTIKELAEIDCSTAKSLHKRFDLNDNVIRLGNGELAERVTRA